MIIMIPAIQITDSAIYNVLYYQLIVQDIVSCRVHNLACWYHYCHYYCYNVRKWISRFTILERNIANTTLTVWSRYQHRQVKLKKRGTAMFLNKSSRCLDLWSNTSANVWYGFSNKYDWGENEGESFANLCKCLVQHSIKTHHHCDFLLSHLLFSFYYQEESVTVDRNKQPLLSAAQRTTLSSTIDDRNTEGISVDNRMKEESCSSLYYSANSSPANDTSYHSWQESAVTVEIRRMK